MHMYMYILQLDLPESVTKRHFLSMSAFTVTPTCVWVTVFGGVSEWITGQSTDDQPIMADTNIFELCKSEYVTMYLD